FLHHISPALIFTLSLHDALPIFHSLGDVPVIAYVFPLIGFFLAPIYPLVNSFVLSSTEKIYHSPMASLLVFFSAVGGTLGSRLVDRKSTRLNSSHLGISYAVFCL